MKYTVKIIAPEKQLKSIPKQDLIKIKNRINSLEHNPRPEGMVKLQENLYRIRQGNYRIIYSIHDNKLLILVVSVGHRREVYRDL